MPESPSGESALAGVIPVCRRATEWTWQTIDETQFQDDDESSDSLVSTSFDGR